MLLLINEKLNLTLPPLPLVGLWVQSIPSIYASHFHLWIVEFILRSLNWRKITKSNIFKSLVERYTTDEKKDHFACSFLIWMMSKCSNSSYRWKPHLNVMCFFFWSTDLHQFFYRYIIFISLSTVFIHNCLRFKFTILHSDFLKYHTFLFYYNFCFSNYQWNFFFAFFAVFFNPTISGFE